MDSVDAARARVHAAGTRSERACRSRSRFSARPMKRRDTFQSERPAGRRVAYGVVLCARASGLLEGKRQVEPQRWWCRVDIRIRRVRVDMHSRTLCRVGDPDGGVQWLEVSSSRGDSHTLWPRRDARRRCVPGQTGRRLAATPACAFRMWVARCPVGEWDRTPRARRQSRGEADRSNAGLCDRAVPLVLPSQEPFYGVGLISSLPARATRLSRTRPTIHPIASQAPGRCRPPRRREQEIHPSHRIQLKPTPTLSTQLQR
jgi:hypothetical protein